jgi:hypothetical protein
MNGKTLRRGKLIIISKSDNSKRFSESQNKHLDWLDARIGSHRHSKRTICQLNEKNLFHNGSTRNF